MSTNFFGLDAEKWVIELLRSSGRRVIPATPTEDKISKIDFYVEGDGYWVAIQFCIGRYRICGQKGIDALRRGIVPNWLDAEQLKLAMNGRPDLKPRLAAQFWQQAEAVVAAHPECRLRRPAVSALRGLNAYKTVPFGGTG